MDTLRLGVRGHDMPKAPFDELVKSISDAGFCCTQLALAKAIRDFDISSGAMTSGMADYMNLPVYVIRLIFVAMVPLAFGAGIFVYIASILMVHWAPEGYIPAGEETPEETDEAESEE